MMRLLIGGIGNVLLGDDGIGPYIIRTLAARYQFESGVEVLDLGTPGLELVSYLSDRDAVILVDSVKSDRSPGTILLYYKSEIIQCDGSAVMDAHAPTLAQCLTICDHIGAAPSAVLMIGVVEQSHEMGCGLSVPVRASVEPVIEAILCELTSLRVCFERRLVCEKPDIWWFQRDQC